MSVPEVVYMLVILLAIVAWAWAAIRRATQREMETACDPVPPLIFRRAWEANAELFTLAGNLSSQTESEAAVAEAETAVIAAAEDLRQRYPHYWPAILFRTAALMRLQQSHPGLLAKWTRDGDAAHGLHPAVLDAAATVPISRSSFDRQAFFDLVWQIAEQMEEPEGEAGP
jgi:hypothetical protein